MTERRAYSIKEFCAAYGVGRTTVYEAIKRGEIPVQRIGRRVVILVHGLAHIRKSDDDERVRATPDNERRKRPAKSVRNVHFLNNAERSRT